MTISLPKINEYYMGELLMFFEMATAFAGELFNINAFNQPGVEEGKNASYAMFGKKGYEEKKYEIENFKFEVIYTPGHRNDLVTYYFYEENIMFTGDFLFKGVIGRTDLEYSSFNDMKKSLIKIYKYSDDIIIYPGHGESSNMKNEKNNNYYLGVYNEK